MVKPFDRPGYTMFNNFIIDHIMPDLSANGFKVLCVAIRQTIGWVDESTDSGRKESDRISWRQFRHKTGIGSLDTVGRAIRECLEKQYLVRFQVGTHQGTGKPLYAYGLNIEYEIAVPETGTGEGEAVPETVTASGAAVTETGTAPVPETGTTKERKKPLKEKDQSINIKKGTLWQAVLTELELQMPKPTFEVYLRDTHLVSHDNGTVTIAVRDDHARQWIEGRLLTIIKRTLVGVVGQPVEVEFVST